MKASDDHKPSTQRRRVLVRATGAVGALGIMGAAWPFVASMEPSARARALGSPVEVDLSGLRPGELHIAQWRRKPVWILHRTQRMLESLEHDAPLLQDPQSTVSSQQPDYAQNRWRSIKPDYLVLIAICTHLGCSPKFRPQPGASGLGKNWPGGFFCPCHGSRFDLAGRVFKGVPAPTNLVVPPYRYTDEAHLIVGT